jgi:hypothetical protein
MSVNQDNPTSTTEATGNISNEAASRTGASPQPTTAETPSPTASEVAPEEAKASASAPHKKKDGKNPRRPKAHGHSERNQRQSADPEAETGVQPGMRERLLARFAMPSVPIDRGLLPEALLGPLDAAGLGRADVLPSSAFMTMAAVAAVAGPHLTFAECADPKLGGKLGAGTSLRVVMVGDRHAGPIVPDAIMGAVYAVENALVAAHEQAEERVASLRRAATERRRLHDQATRAAAVLRIAPPPILPEVLPAHAAARPRIVLNEGARSDVLEAAAGGTGVIVIDGRWVKSMTVGLNHDKPTADLLNALAVGHAVPVEFPDSRTEMRALPACVIGGLAPEECLFLHKVGWDPLTATLFAPTAPAPIGGDSAALTALMRRIHGMTVKPVMMHLPTKTQQTLVAACSAWSAIEARSVAPLSDFVAALPDLARRLASILHLVDCVAGDGIATAEIPVATMKKTLGLIQRFVLPAAQSVLDPVACEEVERDARAMVAHLRLNTSPGVAIARGPWMRNWQNLMPFPRFEAALSLLLHEKLLTPTQGEEGGKWYAAAAELHDAA